MTAYHDRFAGALCGCCARRAIGIGYSDNPRNFSQTIWLCDDPQCLEIAKRTHGMKQDEFTRIESLAVAKGGQEAGAYADQIGKTDFSQFTKDEWFEFGRRMVAGYRKAIKNDLENEVPF